MIISSLSGLRILNTRPASQAADLNKAIAQAGGLSFACPVLEVEATNLQWLESLPSLDIFRVIIFTSVNAVNYFFKGLTKNKGLASVVIIAIGKATAAALRSWQIEKIIIPDFATSESLLELFVLQQVRGKNILLCTGCGGRETIFTALVAHGAIVTKVEVYKRVLPQLNSKILQNIFSKNVIDVILVTSQQTIVNLLQMLQLHPQQLDFRLGTNKRNEGLYTKYMTEDELVCNGAETFNARSIELQKLIFNKYCVVISKRLADYAQMVGFTKVIISDYQNIIITLEKLVAKIRVAKD